MLTIKISNPCRQAEELGQADNRVVPPEGSRKPAGAEAASCTSPAAASSFWIGKNVNHQLAGQRE
jgi:hypothetical protein